MNKLEYKKMLMDIRNNYIDYIRIITLNQTQLEEKSYIIQKDYLNNVTLNLISNNNEFISNIGKLIAYKIFKKKVEKDLTNLTIYYMIEYNENNLLLNKINNKLIQINIAIDFINSITDDEFNNYLKYKIK